VTWCVALPIADFAVGAGAGNFNALGTADVEENKKSHQGEIENKWY
jgi:hypothetical protein